MADETHDGTVAEAKDRVNFPWVICIPRADTAGLAALRLLPGIEVAEEGDAVWVRGQPGDEHLQGRLAALPASERYERLPTNLLRAIDQRIPTRPLPDLRWQPLAAWVQVRTFMAALPGEAPAKVPVRLVRSGVEREPELLLTTLHDLQEFVRVAAKVRLEGLRFAATIRGQVLVRGRRLPPVPGTRFVLQGVVGSSRCDDRSRSRGVAIPAGFAWDPPVSAEVLAKAFGVSPHTMVLWQENGTLTCLHDEHFVPVSRSALRATLAAVADRQ